LKLLSTFDGFANSDPYLQPSLGPQKIVLLDLRSFTRTASTAPFDCIDINCLPQTVTHAGRVSCPTGKWWIAPTPNTDTPIRDLTYQVNNYDKAVLNISRNMLDNEEPQL
jgi:hypothetical protein